MRSQVSNDKITIAITPAEGVAAATDLEGAVIDMSGWNAIKCTLVMGAITALAVTSVKWQQGDESDGSDMADLEDTGITIAADDDNQVFVPELTNPQKRYVQIYVDRATANAVVASAVYEQFRGRGAPVTQPATTTVETNNAPDEGDA